MPVADCFCCGKHATTAVACPGNASTTAPACPDCTAVAWFHFCGCCPVRPHCRKPDHAVTSGLVVSWGTPPEKPTPRRFGSGGVRVLDPWGVRRFRVPAR